jgi:hypothetical protein
MLEDKEATTSQVYIINTVEQMGRMQQLTKWKLSRKQTEKQGKLKET